MTTLAEAATRLDVFIGEGRLIRGNWTGRDNHGRETACLLAAMFPQTGINQSPDACPAGVLPPWLAELTPWIDDSGTLEAWPSQIKRFSAVMHRATFEQLNGCKYQVRAIIVREAMKHTDDASALAACNGTLAWLESADHDDAARSAAWSAARSVAVSPSSFAGRAAWSAARSAAESAAWSAGGGFDAGAAEGAARSAAEGAARSAAEGAAESAGEVAAEGAAADRMIDAFLTLFEAAVQS